MSHFTKSKLGVANKESFKRVLKALGATNVTDETTIKDYFKQSQKVEAAGYFGGYAVGIQKNANGTYDLISDWWGIMPNLPDKVRRALPANFADNHYEGVANFFGQKIAVDTIKTTYEPQGFQVNVTEQKDGSVDIDVVRQANGGW